LTDQQRRAIDFTIQGMDDTQIAHILGINRSTLWRWKTHDPDYRIALTNARDQIRSIAVDRYQNLLLRSTDVLGQFLDDPRENNRFRAAHILLTMVGHFKPLPDSPTPLLEPKQG
jgi:hypothetical protein